jgi:toxin ParE1/3/4
MAVKWTRTALANLAAIVAHIEQDNPERARTFALEIQAKINSLAEFPGIGRPGRVLGTRELVIEPNYIVAYRVRGDVVEILRVQHAARRWPQRL